jgi:hypothetical protein
MTRAALEQFTLLLGGHQPEEAAGLGEGVVDRH